MSSIDPRKRNMIVNASSDFQYDSPFADSDETDSDDNDDYSEELETETN